MMTIVTLMYNANKHNHRYKYTEKGIILLSISRCNIHIKKMLSIPPLESIFRIQPLRTLRCCTCISVDVRYFPRLQYYCAVLLRACASQRFVVRISVGYMHTQWMEAENAHNHKGNEGTFIESFFHPPTRKNKREEGKPLQMISIQHSYFCPFSSLHQMHVVIAIHITHIC